VTQQIAIYKMSCLLSREKLPFYHTLNRHCAIHVVNKWACLVYKQGNPTVIGWGRQPERTDPALPKAHKGCGMGVALGHPSCIEIKR